jgi:glycosyltransferase involved in cell wall biosynthesis
MFGARRIAGRIGFDARLIGALGIGRYISGLLPPLARILEERLVVIAQPHDAAVVRGLLGPRPSLEFVIAPPYRLAGQTRLPLLLARQRLDLVHFPHYDLPLLRPGPFVATIHDLFPMEYPEIHSGPLPRLVNQALLRHAIRRARLLIVPSRATAEAVARRFPQASQRLQVIGEAAGERFTPVRDAAAEAAWQSRLRIRPPYVLYLGQWKAYKNLPLLVQAFERVRARLPSAQLVVAGDDRRHPEVWQLSARFPEGAVVLPGRLPDAAIPDLYRGAGVVVLPSRAEGFGLPVIEALASGVPVVCSDLPVLREIADGVAAFCDPDDPAAFADAIVGALNEPSANLREQGIARAQAYSWQRSAEATVRAYEMVLSGLVRVPLEEDPSRGEDQDLEVQGE